VLGNQTTANSDGFYGLNLQPDFTAASGSTLANLYGIVTNPANDNTGSVTNAYGLLTQISNLVAGGTITNAYGVYLKSPANSGTITHTYALVTEPSAGNVGIGTTTPVHPLQVAGIIGAEEVIVSSTGADYVFRPDYRLSDLSEVASYIKQNHHLPGIPSAQEVQEKGVSLGDMQTKLLAKVEELTLHMIQADEHNKRLEEQNRELQERIARLETRVADGGVQQDSASVNASGH
jgi:hypothetical protein